MRITGGIPVGGNLGYMDLVNRGEPLSFQPFPYYGEPSFMQPLTANVSSNGFIAQAPVRAEQQTLQDYFGALLNPVGFINKTKNLVDKINKRNQETEDAINKMRGY